MTIGIDSLSKYMEYVEGLPSEFSLSRGQAKKFSLLPSALRKDDSGNRKYSRQSIEHFLNEFRVNAHQYITNPWDINGEFEWMIHAQHYGIPTRLLDFTYSHIISIMFAVEKAFSETDEEDAVVYFLNPVKLNDRNARRSTILTPASDESLNLDRLGGSVVVQGRKLNERVNAQNGVFVYFQDTEDALDEVITDEEILRKVFIEASAKKDILVSLYSMGVGFTQVYPELQSVAKDILMKNSIRDYIKEGE